VVDPGGVTARVTPEEEDVAAYLIVVTVVGWAPPGTAAATASASAAEAIRAMRVEPLNPPTSWTAGKRGGSMFGPENST
jgi:hypothetical protein